MTVSAKRDVNDIWNDIATGNMDAADRDLGRIEKAVSNISLNPGIGHIREDLDSRGYRYYGVYSYLIVYRTAPKPAQILRVLHAARNLRALLNLPLSSKMAMASGLSLVL